MKDVNLRSLRKVLLGLLDGTLEIRAVPTGKVPKKNNQAMGSIPRRKAKEAVSKRGRKPGRKPMSVFEKQRKLLQIKAEQLRRAKKALPSPRKIFLALNGKVEGSKMTALAKHFKVKRSLLRELILRLVKKGDLSLDGPVIYLKRRLRTQSKPKEKSVPISENEILNYLKETPRVTLTEMSRDFGEKSYQRFIRVIKRLKISGKVIKSGSRYSLAN